MAHDATPEHRRGLIIPLLTQAFTGDARRVAEALVREAANGFESFNSYRENWQTCKKKVRNPDGSEVMVDEWFLEKVL